MQKSIIGTIRLEAKAFILSFCKDQPDAKSFIILGYQQFMHSLSTLKISLTALFLAAPFFALANAGSPVLWFSLFHLIIINAAIGVIESDIIERYKLPNKLWIAILANYVSMAVGFYLISPSLVKTQYGGGLWDADPAQIMIGFAISFMATLIIEYPFFRAALKNKLQRKLLLKPFLVANVVTNAAMIGIYYLFLAVGF